MAIVCGTDFTENGNQAVSAAAAFAKVLNEPLRLIHVTDKSDDAHFRIQDHAAEAGGRFQIDVDALVQPGNIGDVIVEAAAHVNARLIVVGAVGDRGRRPWQLGSVAERVAQTASSPVLVVRESASIESWAVGKKPLRIMVGADIESTSKAALRWAADLRQYGSCDMAIAQVAWPFSEHSRYGISSPVPLDHLRPELHELLTRDLREWAGQLPPGGETVFEVAPGCGRIDAHLALLASERKCDLLVVGAHHRSRRERLWRGSVSRGVLRYSSCNVICVPSTAVRTEASEIPVYDHVLIPTDLSPLANRAICAGYAVAAPGATVHLLHVVTRKPGEDDPNPSERLRALIPSGVTTKGIQTDLVVVRDDNASAAISHTAERLGADVICMATHGRSGVIHMMLGSQAQDVIRRARQPVLLVPPEREG